ncbi:hypothetical protein B0H16DRAFT_1720260 [Mycena metata]|uniref:Uncharacterized protein n=1 Tax=Mycena metata TaxID=1033252 RepID=A0AAD7JC17_9AGAR|nr:hypothetical protein B0H16DRAFT_1720260 [Mycena metata]
MKHFFMPEPLTHRHVDALMCATVGAFQDEIFQDVDVIEDALHPKHPCTKAHRLRIKESARKQAVFRKEVYNGEKWVISDTLALPYHCARGLMRLISLFLGYILWFTFFCFCRCSASNMSAALFEDDRRQMMGHNPNSDMFFERYQSRLGTFDLRAILAGRLEDEDNIALMKNLRGMSKGRDPNAPIALTAAQHNELHADEELVEFRIAKVGLQARLKQEITKLSSLDDDADDEILAQKEVIDDMRNEIRTIDRKHCAIVSRETHAMIQASRKTYFEEASMRVLQGIEPIKRIPLAATRNVPKPAPAAAGSRTGQENLDPSAPTPARPTRVPRPASQLNAMQEALQVLAHFTPTDTITEHFIVSVNALLGLPDRPSKHCYPGENPTHDNKCPVCNVELIPAKINKGGHNTATHVHTCLMKQFRKEVQTEAESDYEPVACNWEGCKKKGLWPTRAEFCRHVAIHLGNLQRSIWSRGTGVCRWRGEGDAAECGVYNEPNTLELHFAQMHELNVNETIDVEYCVICADVIIDWEGSGVWAMHCEDHYVQLFLPFAERVEGEVEFSDDDLLVCAAVDHAVQFENGSGFAGKHPEFHGHIETQVPVAPMFCPLCVYDDTRDIAVRMRQFERNQDFQSHLDGHRKDILNSVEETQQRSSAAYRPHYVMFHRVPICGSTKHTNLRRLRLPAIAEDDDEADAGDDAAEMEVDVVVGVTVGARGVEVNAEASTSGGGGAVHANTEASISGWGGPGAVAKRKRRRYTASNPKVPTTHYCNLCRLQFVDIREHLPGPCGQQRFKIKDKDVSRTQYGPWHNLAEWSLTAPPFVNDDNDDSDDSDSEAKPSKKVRAPAAPSYQCCGCTKSYSNIAKHFAMVRKPKSKCKLKRFRVRDKDGSWSRPTTLAAWKAAAGAVTVPDLDPSPSSSP